MEFQAYHDFRRKGIFCIFLSLVQRLELLVSEANIGQMQITLQYIFQKIKYHPFP